MRILRDEKGQVLVMTAFSMACLLGALGLAVDVGVLFNARRQMQTAADAAALAGATEVFYNGTGSTSVNSKVYAAAKANGVDQAVSANNVLVTVGPTLSPGNVSCPTCVKVQLSKPNPTFFMHTMSSFFFGNHSFDNVNVSAMGVAGAPGYSHTCMYVMDPTGNDTLDIHGAGKINASGCDVYVNSSSQNALCVTGSAGKSDLSPGGEIVVHGGQDSSGNCKGDPGAPTTLNSGVQSSPYAKTLPIDPTTNCNAGNTIDLAASGGTLSGTVAGPGYGNYVCYKDSAITKGKITPVTLSNATLKAGNYIFETGVTITGATTIGEGNGSISNPATNTNGGATVIVTGGTYDSGTATTFSDWAPADPNNIYDGLAIYQVASDSNPMTLQFGSGSSIFDGAVYAPSAQVTLHDQGGAVNATQLIVGSIYLNGTVNLQNYSALNPTTSPFRVITLVQ
ncbi:MAG TPA: pilus assembly protein TadG-related protein [Terracidiphilus sp.]|nr:pilus assembly protein TadG-related protein [Terracidiphilus sp.]